MPVTFLFIRHGEAQHNVNFHEVGEKAFSDEKNRDAPLTEKGIQQARDLAQKLSSHKIKAIWSSPSTRTIQTSLEIFEETDAQHIYLHDNLLEYHIMGHVCNIRKRKRDIEDTYIGITKTTFLPEFPSIQLETENPTAVYYRMLSMVLLLNHLYKDKDCTIAIVSHKNAIQYLTRKPLENCGFVKMTLDDILNGMNEKDDDSSSGADSRNESDFESD